MEKTIRVDLTKDQKAAQQQSEVRELRDRQIAAAAGDDDAIEMITANRAHKSSNPKYRDYKISEFEKNYVHVLLTERHNNETTKTYESKSSVIPIHAREFDRRVAEGAFATFDEAEVLHDPRPNAPESYALKPAQLAIDPKGPAPDLNIKNFAKREKDLEAREKAVKESSERIGEGLKGREGELLQKEMELAAKEKALAEREAALNRATGVKEGSGSAPDLDIPGVSMGKENPLPQTETQPQTQKPGGKK